MAVTMICPNLKCGRTIVAAESARGKVVRCAHCQILFLVPRDVANAREVKAAETQPPPDDTKHRGRR
jgi:DNA-directed RNA polymerase subunit RPC12/RpoP